MTTLAVLKPDIRIERQEPLSPFGLLAQLFTEELLRRNAQELGTYRPMRLAYLEEEEREGAAAPPEIHFDLDVDLIVNRLLKDREKKEKQEKAKNEKLTPAERILERVILREKEIRIAYPETRRVVIEDGSRRITASLPLGRSPQAAVQAGGKPGRTDRDSGRPERGAARKKRKYCVPLRRCRGQTPPSFP